MTARDDETARPAREWDADDYARHSSPQQEWARELIAKLQLRGDEALLDVGCGDGRATAEIAARVPSGTALGIDSSAAMIGLARRRFPPSDHPNLAFLHMDAADIRLPRTFDVVFSNAALHWVADHRAVLRGVRRSLTSRGRLLFQMGGQGNAAETFVVVGEVMTRPRWRQYFEGFVCPYHFYGPGDYAAWLHETGFCLVRAELLPKDMQHHDGEALLGWLRTTWFPYTDRLPEESRDAFLADVVTAYTTAHPADERGIVHAKMVRLEVEARCV